MRLRGKAGASWHILLSALLWTVVFAKTETPTVKVETIKHPPGSLSYFEDSNSILYLDVVERNIYNSQDAGFSWSKAKSIPDGKAWMLVMHEFDPERAYVVTEGLEHWKTEDRGKTWSKWESGTIASAFRDDILHFHGGDKNRILFNGMDCAGIFCEEVAMYTVDGFKTKGKFLRGNTAGCWWAKASRLFGTGKEDLDSQRILCIVRDPFSPFKEDQRLFISDNFFETIDDRIQEFEPDMDTNHGVQGIVNLAVVKKYLLVATTSLNTDEMGLFVTDDTLKWHRAIFPTDHGHKIHQEAYTVLESTNYSIQIDVMTTRPSNPMGVMFTSNSNGTYFTENFEHTNRSPRGHVDFEKITGIQGIFLLNTVANWEEVEKSFKHKKKITTSITFDDGRTFEHIKAGDERLHLHSVTNLDNTGKVFSSPAPGVVMGIGNIGDSLDDFGKGHLYVSDNAGISWKKALDGPHKYEFGDQGSILVAIKDSDKAEIGEFSYSLDHGDNWKQVSLPDNLKIRPEFLTTTQDSTSMKFLLVGKSGSSESPNYHLIAIDFEGLHERTCGDDDMEDWHARAGDDGKPSCIMGHKQTYRRRKKTAECFLKVEWRDPVPVTEDCECTEKDFECDYNFVRDAEGKTCKAAGPIISPEEACKDARPDDTFKGSSGYRKIPGNTCNRKSGAQKDDLVDRPCSDSVKPPAPPPDGEIKSGQHVFKSEFKEFDKFYLERGDSSSDDDETIIVRPIEWDSKGRKKVENKLWRTQDHGKKWDRILEEENVLGIMPHQYFKDFVFFTTTSHKVLYTIDRGKSFHHFDAPTKPAGDNVPLAFHPDKKDWLIWVGEVCEKSDGKEQCFKAASLSIDRGDNWRTVMRYVSKCEFTGHSAYNFRPLKQIVCLGKMREDNDGDNPNRIYSSNDFFLEDKKVHDDEMKDVKDFATMAEFIVVAAADKANDGLQALASLDGETYADAHFPANFKVDHQNAYTVLDSSTHAVNLFVATETAEGRRYGSIIKSNSNGTSYVLSASAVNCNDRYYVDFEKIPGLDGLTVINTVANQDKPNEPKKLQTKITHNDGAEWSFLPPPAKDIEDKSYPCTSRLGDENCALHFHHYTEREDKKKTFSASTAVGMMFGVGNVGPTLGSIKDADTFMTTDAGVTWKNVKKGAWTWQYGDQGSLTVLVQRWSRDHELTTKTVWYSTDEGNTWKEHPFTESEVKVLDITTLRSGSSRNFLLWCKGENGELFSVNLDFTGLTSRPCDAKEDADTDYYLWSPKHPLSDSDCLFGHVSQYLRKKPDRECYNDKRVQHLYQISNCSCTRQDFEW
jgi:hypothetical protein